MIIPYVPGIMCSILQQQGCSYDYCMRNIFGAAHVPHEPEPAVIFEFEQLLCLLQAKELEDGEIAEH